MSDLSIEQYWAVFKAAFVCSTATAGNSGLSFMRRCIAARITTGSVRRTTEHKCGSITAAYVA